MFLLYCLGIFMMACDICKIFDEKKAYARLQRNFKIALSP